MALVKKIKPIEEEPLEEEITTLGKLIEVPSGGIVAEPLFEVKADRGTYTGLHRYEVQNLVDSLLAHVGKIIITKI